MTLIRLTDVSLQYGTKQIFDNITLNVEANERLCLMGRNGAGKSTLMKALHELIEFESGSIFKKPGLKIGYLPQEVPSDLKGSIYELTASGFGEFGECLARSSALHKKQSLSPDEEVELAKLEQQLQEHGGWSLQAQIEKTLSFLKLDGSLPTETLSSGMKRRALLARALVTEPDLILLDEPTNHLDIPSIQDLEELLVKMGASVLFTSHDRSFIRRLSTSLLELDRGFLRRYEGGYQKYLELKQAELDSEEKQQADFDKKLAQEEVWIRKGIKARRVRNQGRVRALEKMRRERQARRDRVGQAKFQINQEKKSGNLVVKAKDLSFRHDKDQAPIIDRFSCQIMRGDRIGIIGPNGVGKSTLLKLLTEELSPDDGTIKHGTNLDIVYFDQLREQLDEDRSVADNIAGGAEMIDIRGNKRHVIGYLQDFLFSAERARCQITELSGGERNRLLLARLLTKPANLLILDEPTNDLDAETLELLEERLIEFPGTLLLVSHDREFLNNVVTSCFVFEGQGQVKEYVGGYDDWLRQRPKPAPQKTAPSPSKQTEGATQTQRRRTKKLSYNEKRELLGLPDKIEELENQVAELTDQMSDAEFFKQDAEAIKAHTNQLEESQRELELAYSRWEQLEEKREASGEVI